MRTVPYTSSVTKPRSRSDNCDRRSKAGVTRLAKAPSSSMRTSASRASARARSGFSSFPQAFVGPGVSAVQPCRGRHRPLALGLHINELEGAVAGANACAIEGAGRQPVGRNAGPRHLEALSPERRPCVSQANDPEHLDGRACPVDVMLSGVDLVGIGRLSRLWR